MNFCEKSTPPVITPIRGMIISATTEETILLKAPPTTTAVARAIISPFIKKVLKSLKNAMND
jgi:hypothetical protein